MGRPKTTFTTADGTRFKTYTSARTGRPSLLAEDVSDYLDVTYSTAATKIPKRMGVTFSRSVETIHVKRRAVSRVVMDVPDLQTLRDFYADTSRAVRRRAHHLERLDALIEGLTTFQVEVGARPAEEPEIEVKQEDPANVGFVATLGDVLTGGATPDAILTMIRQEIANAVRTGIEGAKSHSTVSLDEKDVKAIRKIIREEVAEALKKHVKAQGGAARDIVVSMNGVTSDAAAEVMARCASPRGSGTAETRQGCQMTFGGRRPARRHTFKLIDGEWQPETELGLKHLREADRAVLADGTVIKDRAAHQQLSFMDEVSKRFGAP